MEVSIDELKFLLTKEPQITERDSWVNVGENYFIRTVTHYYLGRVTRVTPYEIVLSDAAWIGDTGRFSDFLKNGRTDTMEVEPYLEPVAVSRAAVVDIARWTHDLLTNQM